MINLRDNREVHDKEPFVPFGRVVQGMDVARAAIAARSANSEDQSRSACVSEAINPQSCGG